MHTRLRLPRSRIQRFFATVHGTAIYGVASAETNGERIVEAKIYSRTDIFSDHRLQRSKHGSNCARSTEQQNMLALQYFSIPEAFVVRGGTKSRPKIHRHLRKGNTKVLALLLALPTSPYYAAAIAKFG